VEDARYPLRYRMVVGMVDVIFADVAQPDQARIVGHNAEFFLKNGGHFVISIKANCIDSTVAAEAVFASEILTLRKSILQWTTAPKQTDAAAVEFRTLHSWFLHFMSVWHVLDRFGTNLLHYRTIREVELAKDLEEISKDVVQTHVNGEQGLSAQGRDLLELFTGRLASESAEVLDPGFRSELQTIADQCLAQMQASFGELSSACRAKSGAVQGMKRELEQKLRQSCGYAQDLLLHTWQLQVHAATERSKTQELKRHFKNAIEGILAQAGSTHGLAELQPRSSSTRSGPRTSGCSASAWRGASRRSGRSPRTPAAS